MFKVYYRNYNTLLAVIAVLLGFLVLQSFGSKSESKDADTKENLEVITYNYKHKPIYTQAQMESLTGSYQLRFPDDEHVAIYDEDRLIGVIPYHKDCPIWKALDRDNE